MSVKAVENELDRTGVLLAKGGQVDRIRNLLQFAASP